VHNFYHRIFGSTHVTALPANSKVGEAHEGQDYKLCTNNLLVGMALLKPEGSNRHNLGRYQS